MTAVLYFLSLYLSLWLAGKIRGEYLLKFNHKLNKRRNVKNKQCIKFFSETKKSDLKWNEIK